MRFRPGHLLLVLVLALVAYVVPRSLGIGEASHAYDRAGCGAVRTPADTLSAPAARTMVVCLLNSERTAAGLQPLYVNPQLEAASQAHSDDMVRRRFFEHVAPGGATPEDRMAAAGYVAHEGGMTGENIGWGEDTEGSPASVVDTWMHSPHHRDNILRPQFSEVGVGIAVGGPPGRQHTRDESATYTTDFGG